MSKSSAHRDEHKGADVAGGWADGEDGDDGHQRVEGLKDGVEGHAQEARRLGVFGLVGAVSVQAERCFCDHQPCRWPQVQKRSLQESLASLRASVWNRFTLWWSLQCSKDRFSWDGSNRSECRLSILPLLGRNPTARVACTQTVSDTLLNTSVNYQCDWALRLRSELTSQPGQAPLGKARWGFRWRRQAELYNLGITSVQKRQCSGGC